MKKTRLNFLIVSLPAAIALFPYSATYAALRVNNSSLVQGQIQSANAMREMALAAQVSAPQPARTITDANGNTTTISDTQMDSCNAVYPGGVFDWVSPTIGMRAGAGATCASLVEMRSYNAGGTAYTVLASGYLASGDAVRCNIDNFANISVAGREFTYPADNPPTIEDVEKVMAAENKSNAGFKILAAAVVGGLGGNLLGQGEDGLGTNKEKLKTTAIGAVGGAALMTASTQVNDYKTGTVILSTGVNTAAGAVAGNVMATGDDVLQIDDCDIKVGDTKTKAKCVYGTITRKSSSNTADTPAQGKKWFWDYDSDRYYECDEVSDNNNGNSTFKNCRQLSLSIKSLTDFSDAFCASTFDATECKAVITSATKPTKYGYDDNKSKEKILSKEDTGTYVEIKEATRADSRIGAMVKLDSDANNIFGYKSEDWKNRNGEKSKLKVSDKPIYDLYGDVMSDAEISDFKPAYKSVSDGSVVDFSNQARTKSTLIGAGAGGALGALSGAAGADSAIQERYVTAIREYNDSLRNIVCYTGNRYLAPYNDIAIIPEMKDVE